MFKIILRSLIICCSLISCRNGNTLDKNDRPEVEISFKGISNIAYQNPKPDAYGNTPDAYGDFGGKIKFTKEKIQIYNKENVAVSELNIDRTYYFDSNKSEIHYEVGNEEIKLNLKENSIGKVQWSTHKSLKIFYQ